MFQITSRVNRIEYMTLMTDYEPRNHDTFTIIAGQRVTTVDFVPDGLEAFRFPGGDYLVFYARGEMSWAVDRAYEEIDRFFQSSAEWSREWTVDFEVSGKVLDQTDIYIAVKRIAGAP
jgi:predicted transcriptional regulator YdeE